LKDHADVLKHRFSVVEKWAGDIARSEGGLEKFSKVSYCIIRNIARVLRCML
jgi:hypothetical protein